MALWPPWLKHAATSHPKGAEGLHPSSAAVLLAGRSKAPGMQGVRVLWAGGAEPADGTCRSSWQLDCPRDKDKLSWLKLA